MSFKFFDDFSAPSNILWGTIWLLIGKGLDKLHQKWGLKKTLTGGVYASMVIIGIIAAHLGVLIGVTNGPDLINENILQTNYLVYDPVRIGVIPGLVLFFVIAGPYLVYQFGKDLKELILCHN